MQSIYEFKVKKEIEEEVKEQTENGLLVTNEKVEKLINIICKKPNRLESEEADIVSAVEFSESIRKGILTKPLLEKLYDEKGGFLAENYENKYGKLLARFFELENEYHRFDLKDDKTEEDREKLKTTAAELVTVRNKIQALEASRNSLFQNTAENRAQNKTIFWLTLYLTYIQENEMPTPFFIGKTFEEKRDDYDKKIEENNQFYNQVIDKASFFIGLWYLGRASTKEDFKQIEDSLNERTSSPEEDTAETASESL